MKDENRLALWTVLAVNLLLFYTTVKGDEILAGEWMALAQDIGSALPASIGIIVTGIVNDQLSAENKSRVVFMRWNNPLPASYAFTWHATSDSRVDVSSLEHKYGPLPNQPREQNKLWYKLYRSIEAEPAVRQAHRAYLFARDYSCLALMMAIVLGGAGLLQISPSRAALIYLGILIAQFILAGQAARNRGARFVTTVLAIKGAEMEGESS